MAFISAEPVASGKPYRIAQVEDHSPAGLDDFLGSTAFTLSSGSTAHQVFGVGAADGQDVRFQEKDTATARDVRVWRIHREPDGAFVAEPLSCF